jgi:cyclohexa-1,5-dienecarbonyl-CoA hydratase
VSSEDAGRPASIVVSVAEDATLLRILLNRPKGNILGRAMMGEIGAALDAHRADRSLRLVLIAGAGGNFSYGASVEEHRRDQAPAMLRDFHEFVRAVARYPVPVAALVQGRCLGGAFETVLACHLVFATPSARFGCPEIKLGVFAPVLAAAGGLRLGGGLAERLLLTGDEIDAATAERSGLVTQVFPDDADAEAQVLAWHRRALRPLSAYAIRQAVRAARQCSPLLAALGGPLDAAERQYIDSTLASHDGNEGIEAFLARRPAAWTDA